MSNIRTTLAISFAERYSALLIGFVSTIVIARLLTPREIGIYSVGAAAIAVAHTVRDFGVTSYLIQEPELTPARIRTAFTITLIMAWSLAGFIWVATPFIAAFYNEPGLIMVLQVIVLNFVMIPLGSVSLALLRREMKFSSIYWISITSAMAHAGVGICLASLGFGFMSLAWAGLTGVAVTVIGALLAAPQHYVTRPTLSEHARVFGFGSRMSAASIVSEVGAVAPDLIVGRMLGFTSLGYFNRALGFVQLFERTVTDALRPVMLPYFSREHRDGQDVQAAYLRAFEYTLGIAWPFLAILAWLAEPLIRLLYGNQWDAAVPLAQVLCLAIAVRVVNPLTASVLVASGAVHEVMVVQALYQSLKVVLLISGSLMGLFEAAWGLTVAEVVGCFLFLNLVHRKLKVPLKSLVPIVYRALSLTAFVIMLTAIVLYIAELEFTNHVLSCLLALLMGSLAWLTGLKLFVHPLQEEVRRIFQGR